MSLQARNTIIFDKQKENNVETWWGTIHMLDVHLMCGHISTIRAKFHKLKRSTVYCLQCYDVLMKHHSHRSHRYPCDQLITHWETGGNILPSQFLTNSWLIPTKWPDFACENSQNKDNCDCIFRLQMQNSFSHQLPLQEWAAFWSRRFLWLSFSHIS